MVALDTGTNFPAVSTNSLFAILMTKLRQRRNFKGVPTQSQPQAASLTLSACNVAIQVHREFKKKFQDNATGKLVMVKFAARNRTYGRDATSIKLPYIS
jgi:hypothetical protein